VTRFDLIRSSSSVVLKVQLRVAADSDNVLTCDFYIWALGTSQYNLYNWETWFLPLVPRIRE